MKERPNPCFTFTEREQLYDRISHKRFMTLIQQPEVDIHEVELSTNSFGEYLFVTVSCRTEQPPKLLTFWGLGYHEYRERWVADTWQWYDSYRKSEKLPVMPKDPALAEIREREDFVRTHASPTAQSERAKLYEFIANLTDEDGALNELEDLGWAILSDNDEEIGSSSDHFS